MSSPRRKTTAKPQQSRWIKKRAWLGWVLIPVLALAVYVPFVKGPFLFDDQPHIYRNQTVLSFKGPFDFESLRAPFVTAYGLSNRPLLYITYGLNRWAFGLNPTAFRATNIFIHLFNATIVLLLTRRIAQLAGRTKSEEFWISLIASSLFLVHPLLT